MKERLTTTFTYERVLGHYTQDQPGPMVMVMAGVHGNEKAGIHALQRVFDALQAQKNFQDHLVAFAGNLPALEQNLRYVDIDLNRQWYKSKVSRIVRANPQALTCNEDLQQKALIDAAMYYLKQRHRDHEFLFLDLHTTSAYGGEFSICNSQQASLDNALTLQVPVITGLAKVLKGTTLQFFEDRDLPAMGFEGGQHDDPISIDNMEAAIWSVLRSTGCLAAEDIPHFAQHQQRLKKLAEGMPNIVSFLYRHEVKDDDEFVMRPGFSNFQSVLKGEVLARDRHGEITAPVSGLMLMPLYQSKGSDGFFIVEEVRQ